MKRLLLAFIALCALWGHAFADPPVPRSNRGAWVVDNAKVLSYAEKERLSDLLEKLWKDTGGRGKGVQFAIITEHGLAGDSVTYGMNVLRQWKLGTAGYSSDGKNQGMVLAYITGRDVKGTRLGAPQYGLALGDGLYVKLGGGNTAPSLEPYFGPRSTAKSVGEAMEKAVLALGTQIKPGFAGVGTREHRPVTEERKAEIRVIGYLLLFTLMAVVSGWIGSILHRRRKLFRYWFGGGLGGSSFAGTAYAIGLMLPVIIGLGVVGYIAGYFIAKLLRQRVYSNGSGSGDSGVHFWYCGGGDSGGGGARAGLHGEGGTGSGAGHGGSGADLPSTSSGPSSCDGPSGCDAGPGDCGC